MVIKKETLVEWLRILLHSWQRYRAGSAEMIGLGEGRMEKEMWPWVFGDKCPVPAIARILGKYEDTGELDNMEVYNILFIAYHFAPEIVVTSEISCNLVGLDGLPEELPSVSEILRVTS